MIVSAWHNGTGTYGISVGKPNRRAYFDKSWDHIQVDIEGKVYRFELTPGFWRNCPEFRDKGHTIIQDWLKKRKKLTWPYRQNPEAKLIPIGVRRFRLEP